MTVWRLASVEQPPVSVSVLTARFDNDLDQWELSSMPGSEVGDKWSHWSIPIPPSNHSPLEDALQRIYLCVEQFAAQQRRHMTLNPTNYLGTSEDDFILFFAESGVEEI